MERCHPSWLGLKQFPTELSALDLDQFFTLDVADQQIVRSCRRSGHGLRIALQIGFIRMTGCTLDVVKIAPLAVLHHVASQSHLLAPGIASLRAMYARRRTLNEHQQLARMATGFSEPGDFMSRVRCGQLSEVGVMMSQGLNPLVYTTICRKLIVLTQGPFRLYFVRLFLGVQRKE